MSAQNDLPVASLKDSVATLARVVTPTLAKGVLIRRPRVVGMAETLALDDRAVRQMQKLRERYGSGPLMIRVPGPPRAVILSPEDARPVLDNSPEPFATASSKKRAALSHFEPKNALISPRPRPAFRPSRRLRASAAGARGRRRGAGLGHVQ